MSFYGRSEEFRYLENFLQETGSGFMYVRGRRRIGKSWLLKHFAEKHTNCFYFMGSADASDQSLQEEFAKEWDAFANKVYLTELKADSLSWKRIFQEIYQFALSIQTPLIIIFDEIQWIAKKGSGFLGKLKEAWLDWERTDQIKVIICGSSNRFFQQVTGGEEKIMRGLITYGTLWVKPFTLSEVKKYYFPHWSLQEICLTYMMFGGVPYYLERLDPEAGFIHSINDATFTQKSVFLYEIDEILRLDFNRKGQKTIKKILCSLDATGSTQKRIIQKTGIPASTLSEAIEQLVDYGLLRAELPMHTKPSRNGANYRYYLNDFFLNFYCQVLESIIPIERKIITI